MGAQARKILAVSLTFPATVIRLLGTMAQAISIILLALLIIVLLVALLIKATKPLSHRVALNKEVAKALKDLLAERTERNNPNSSGVLY